MKRLIAALAMVLLADQARSSPLAFTDAVLQTDSGREVRFSPELFSAPVTIVSFTFTGCTSVCPTASLVMNEVRKLGQGEGADIALMTFTLDPLNDVPEVLAAHRKRMGLANDPQWLWLTGNPKNLIGSLERLGMKWGALDQHPSFFLLIAKGGTQAQSLWELETTPRMLIDAAQAFASR